MHNCYLRVFFLFIMFNCWLKTLSLHDSFPQIKSCWTAETLERGKHSLNGVNVCIIFSCDEWKCRRLNSAIDSSITPLPPWLLGGGGLTQRDNAHCQRHQSRGFDVTPSSESRDNVSSHLYAYKVASATLSNEDTFIEPNFCLLSSLNVIKTCY